MKKNGLSIRIGDYYQFFENDKWMPPVKLVRISRTFCGWYHFEREDGSPIVYSGTYFISLADWRLAKKC